MLSLPKFFQLNLLMILSERVNTILQNNFITAAKGWESSTCASLLKYLSLSVKSLLLHTSVKNIFIWFVDIFLLTKNFFIWFVDTFLLTGYFLFGVSTSFCLPNTYFFVIRSFFSDRIKRYFVICNFFSDPIK